MLAPSSSAPIADTSTTSLVRTNSRNVSFSREPTASRPRGSCQLLPALAVPSGTFYVEAGNGCEFTQNRRFFLAVIVPFESHSAGSIDQLVELVAADMDRVNAT